MVPKSRYEPVPVLYSSWYPVTPVALTGAFQTRKICVLDTGDAARFLGARGTGSIAKADKIPPCATSPLERRITARESPSIFTVQVFGFF